MDWLAKMLGLPDKFLHHHPDSVGGGVLQVGGIRDDLIMFCFVFTEVNFLLGDCFPGGKTKDICSIGLIRGIYQFDTAFPNFSIKYSR